MPLLIVDKNGLLKRWNREVERYFGLDPFDGCHDNFQLESLIDSRSHSFMSDVRTAVSGGFLTVMVRQNEGVESKTRLSLNVVRFVVDGATYFLLAGREELPMMQNFKVLNQKLKAANQKAARERERLETLKIQNEELNQFTSATAHDLKTPLIQTKMLLKMVLDDYGYDLPVDASALLGKASNTIDNLNEMISQILSYAHSDPRLIHQQVIDLDEAVLSVSDSVDAIIQNIGATITVSRPLGSVTGHPMLFQQLMNNLLSNAIKYRHADRPLEILVTPEYEGERTVALRIRDNGIGFEKNQANSLFEKFTQLNIDASEGYGIGLSTCARICKAHNWTIDATGVKDQGAEFRICFSSDQALQNEQNIAT